MRGELASGRADVWPAAGSEDTELGVNMEPGCVMERRKLTREFKLEAVRLISRRDGLILSHPSTGPLLQCSPSHNHPPQNPARRKPIVMYVQFRINRHNKPVR